MGCQDFCIESIVISEQTLNAGIRNFSISAGVLLTDEDCLSRHMTKERMTMPEFPRRERGYRHVLRGYIKRTR